MYRFLLIRLEGALAAYGDISVDARGPVRQTPAPSTLTGLLANALGYDRTQAGALEALQSRLIFGCRVERHGTRFVEFQTAMLKYDDRGWTTRGRRDERAGGKATYDNPYLRQRDYICDSRMTVALRLVDADVTPTIEELRVALESPARPLFLGRKACPPAGRLIAGDITASSAWDALCRAPFESEHECLLRGIPLRVDDTMTFVVPASEPYPDGFRAVRSTGKRDWATGAHTGEQTHFERRVATERSALPHDSIIIS
jgi:CRISPR system Cascade subunit CasD